MTEIDTLTTFVWVGWTSRFSHVFCGKYMSMLGMVAYTSKSSSKEVEARLRGLQATAPSKEENMGKF